MIIAVDFDGTLCESRYPEMGQPNIPLIKGLKEKQEQGDKLILWTCRSGEYLENAVEWCKGHGLFFDSVNENLPEILELWGNDSRKITADIYIDDKATQPMHFAC